MPLVRAMGNTLIASILVISSVMCIAIAVGLLQQRHASAQFTRCTAEWQADFLNAYAARSNASLAVSRSMDHVVQAVYDNDPKAFRRAVRHYLTVRHQQTKERAQNPLPSLPAVRCGG